MVKPHPNLFSYTCHFLGQWGRAKRGTLKKERLTHKTKVTMALCGDAPCILSLVSHNTQTIPQRCRDVVCFCSFFARLKSKNACKLLAYKRFLIVVVPRPGLEPGWVSPLVFETSASTDSAIWAFNGCKGTHNIYTSQTFLSKTLPDAVSQPKKTLPLWTE